MSQRRARPAQRVPCGMDEGANNNSRGRLAKSDITLRERRSGNLPYSTPKLFES